MGRLVDALLNGKAFSKGHTNPMLDLSYGGQMGYAPDLTQWVSNGAYIRKQLICLLIEPPKFFQYLPEPEKYTATLKALLELHAKTIEGFNAGLTVDTVDTPVGGGGEMQDEFVDVKQARSQPVFTWDEKYGMPIQSFFRDWITLGMMDPNSKFAGVGTLSNHPTDMLADMYSATCMFIEPDPTHRKVVKSWLTTNMWPKMSGDVIGKREITAGSEITTYSIDFTGVSQYNLGGNILAQTLLDGINITNANPYLRPAFVDGLSADVARQTDGYKAGIENLAAVAVVRS